MHKYLYRFHDKFAYFVSQLSGWLTLYTIIMVSIFNKHYFSAIELLFGAVLIGSSAVGSHLMRRTYKAIIFKKSTIRQFLFFGFASIFVAALATLLLISTVFGLAHLGITDPIPASQSTFMIKTIAIGNFFNMLLALLFWSALYFSISKVRQLRQTSELLKSSKLDALIHQLNPHFLFNAINNIRALILEDPARAREMLARLADMLRYSLSKDDTSKVTLNSELAIVDEYIALCSIQFEDRLRFSVSAPVSVQQALVPKLLLQLCVENAIKHGISTEINGGGIDVTVYQTDQMLDVIIRNDVTLHNDAKHHGVGLRNIRQRLALLYPECSATGLRLYHQNSKVITHVRLPLEF
ncbi:MAG: transcriptional regulator [Rheinheimera sp.]|nr:transcriptional regulator [Rheinheimera sp.]